MMLKTAERHITRAKHRAWRSDLTSVFDQCVTLDPSRTLEAWDTLVQDTVWLEIKQLPYEARWK
jgi:hypothetical protein